MVALRGSPSGDSADPKFSITLMFNLANAVLLYTLQVSVNPTIISPLLWVELNPLTSINNP